MTATGTRQRLTREARFTQLVAVAWQIIRDEGTEALTLSHLAETRRCHQARGLRPFHQPLRSAGCAVS